MSAYTESAVIEKRENESTYLRNDAENVRLVRFPKEVTVFGNISRVYIEGEDNQEKLIFKRDQLPPPQERYAQKIKNYVIIPVKDSSSEIHFVKAPVYKLCRNPKAKRVGDAQFRKLNPFGAETTAANLPEWAANRAEIDHWNESVRAPDTETGTSFRFCQTESSEIQDCILVPQAVVVRESEEQERSEVKDSPEEKKDEGTREESPTSSRESSLKEVQNPPPEKKQKRKRRSEKGSSRFLQYLITLKGRSRKGKKY